MATLYFLAVSDQQARFPDGARERLLHVDVLAALHAPDGRGGVHEIGNGDDDRVDVLAFLVEHLAEVFVLGSLSYLLDIARRPRHRHRTRRQCFPFAQCVRSLAALPPAPMEAMFSFSFGDL